MFPRGFPIHCCCVAVFLKIDSLLLSVTVHKRFHHTCFLFLWCVIMNVGQIFYSINKKNATEFKSVSAGPALQEIKYGIEHFKT